MERYGTFWRRLGAGIFDGIMLLPLSYVAVKYSDAENPYSYLLWSAFQFFISMLYSVLLTGLVGQTIGKIVMGVKVLDLNEKSVIGIKRAFYRESIFFFVGIVSLLYLSYQMLT